MSPHFVPVFLLATHALACAPDAPADLAAERAALLDLHERILAAHRADDVDGWLALEADTLIVGNRGDLFFSGKTERAEIRGRYLGATDFSVYRDMQPPIVQVADDASLGWVFAQVEIVGVQGEPPDTASIHDVWTWVELYERRPEGWRLVGNVSTAKP